MARQPRTFEAAMRVIVLQVADASRTGSISTNQAKADANKFFTPSAGDLRPNPKRAGEPMYYQIVGNVIGSHENSRTSIYHNGYAEKIEDGVRITDAGRAYLRSKGL